MDKLNWHLAVTTICGNKILPQPGPKVSGDYLCTCFASRVDGMHKYLRMMTYDAEKEYWHDPGRENSQSNNVLAWAEVDLCEYNKFFNLGGYPIQDN